MELFEMPETEQVLWELAAAVKDDPRAASVWECIKAYERHCREEKAYQQYLKELDEYNNSKQ